MRTYICVKAFLLALALLITTFPVASQEIQSNWTPPPNRKKAFTLFAPRPFKGNNIFKGDAEVWLADAIEKIEGGISVKIDDKFVVEYVSQVGKNLALYSAKPSKPYEFFVLDDESINAMSIGGGRIYINIGLLKSVESEDELAGVLAHEIAHDAFGHSPKTITRQLFWMKGIKKVNTFADVESALSGLLNEYEKKPLAAIGETLLGFSRFDELEADRAGFYNVYKAGYNPRALSSILKRIQSEEKKELGNDYRKRQLLAILFGSHPPTAQRTITLSWESIFVKIPPKESSYQNPAFDAMKVKVRSL